MRSGPTIKDIARAVGVTPATVSYVLSQNPRQSISAQTRQKVLDAARELGYVPNGAAKVLRNAPRYCVGVAIEKELMLSRFSMVLQGIRDRLEGEGYNLMLCSFGQRHGIYPDYINNTLERRIDGVIFMGKDNTGPTPEAEELIARYHLPFVLYDCGYTGCPYSTVELDYEQAGFDMADSMLAGGAHRLLYLRPDADNYQEQQREAGVRRALAARPDVTLQVMCTDTTRDMVRYTPQDRLGLGIELKADEGVARFLAGQVIPALAEFAPHDGVITSWGVYAPLLYSLLAQAGKSLQIGALSDMLVSGMLQGRIKVCRMPGYQAGVECARLLLARLAGDETPQTRTLPMPLGNPAMYF